MLNILFIWVKGKLSNFNLTCMQRARAVYRDANFKMLTDQPVPFKWLQPIDARYLGEHSPQVYSDYARLLYLSENSYTLYIDCDAYCLWPIPMDDLGYAGIWAIYNRNKLEAIKGILKNSRGQKMKAWYGKDLILAGVGISRYFLHREREVIKFLKKGKS